jgi:hypothetical protein
LLDNVSNWLPAHVACDGIKGLHELSSVVTKADFDLLTQVLDIKSLAPEVQKELQEAKRLCKQGPSLLTERKVTTNEDKAASLNQAGQNNLTSQNQQPVEPLKNEQNKGVLSIGYQDLVFDVPEKKVC